MPSRTQVTLDAQLDRRAKARARSLGLSFAQYVRRLLERDLGEAPASTPVSQVFALGDSGGSDVAANKDAYLGAATAEWATQRRAAEDFVGDGAGDGVR